MTTPLRFGIEGRDETAAAFERLGRRIADVDGKTRNWISTLSHLSQLSRNVFAGFQSMVRGVEGLLAPSQKLVNLEVQLAAALAKSGQLTDQNYQSLLRFASARQDVTLFSREVSLRMATIGAEFGLTTEQITRSIEAVQDRSFQLARDPIELFRGYAKALAGIGNEWTELGLHVDRTADRHTKFSQAVAQMRSGVSEMVAELSTNAFARLGNRFADIADSLGRVIASTKTFQSIMRVLDGFARSLRDALGDPAAILKIAGVIDAVVQRIVQALAFGASVVVRVAAVIVGAIEDIRETIKSALNAGEIAKLREEYEKLWAATEGRRTAQDQDRLFGIRDTVEKLRGAGTGLGRELTGIADAMERFSRQGSIFGAGPFAAITSQVAAFVAALKNSAPAIQQFSDSQRDAVRILIDDLGQLEELEKLRELALEQNRAWGENLAQTFSLGVQDAFDRDIGAREAFRRLGDDIMSTFRAQFSDAAFDPIKESFGQLAKALAAPFHLVGRVINAVLSPITALVEKVITYLVTQLAAMFGMQVTQAAASAAMIKALAVQIAATASGWGAAAMAASIATVGGALSVVPSTLTAIGSGAALTAALAVPKAAKGAFVEPRPGGTLMQVAEGGQAEVIAPMPQLLAAFRQVAGGAGGGLTIQFSGPMSLSSERFARDVADEMLNELSLRKARDRNYRGGLY